MNEGLVIGLPVGDFVLLLCHGVVCIIRIMRDLILPLGKSSIYSTKPWQSRSSGAPPGALTTKPLSTGGPSFLAG